jgi:hypothetical protein
LPIVATNVEFGTKATADRYREQYEEYLCSEDDARLKTVTFNSDTPEWLLEQAELEALETRGEAEASTGQIALSDHERDRIDFSKQRASVPHARAVKAIAAEQGIDDWLAHYDPTLTVEEHRPEMERARQSQAGGRRMDSEEERQAERQRDASRAAQSNQCDHARGHCQNGDPEACEFLRDACGFEQSEIEEFLPDEPDEQNPDKISGKAAGALSRSWGGYRGAVRVLDEALTRLEEEWSHAQGAARAINAIRREHGQDPMHFHALEKVQADLADLVRQAAADCHECHADHSEHDHGGDERESLTDLELTERDAPPEDVIEQDAQRDLEGDRANDQARLAGGEPGEQDAEIEATEEENPGGLMADEREETEETGDTEQAIPDEFNVPEGGQGTL